MKEMEAYRNYMALALQLAQEEPEEVPVGALIVRDGSIIAQAHNERESGAMDPFGHAEMLAMRRAAQALGTRRLSGCTMYVTLEPCPMCAGAMLQAGLSSCVFAAFDTQQGCCGSVYDLTQDRHFSHHVRCAGGLMEEEAKEQLRRFFASKRKKPSAEGRLSSQSDDQPTAY